MAPQSTPNTATMTHGYIVQKEPNQGWMDGWIQYSLPLASSSCAWACHTGQTDACRCTFINKSWCQPNLKAYLVNFFVLFLTIFGLEAGVSAIASERFDFHVSRKFWWGKTFKVQTADKRMKLLFNIEKMENLVEQAEAHVIVFLLGLFLLLLLLGGLNVGNKH